MEILDANHLYESSHLARSARVSIWAYRIEHVNSNFTGLQKSGIIENYFCSFSTKTYVMSAQKNHLNETVLVSTQT